MNAERLHLKPPQTAELLFFRKYPVQTHHFHRHYKRRRVKPSTRNLALRCNLLDPFQNFLSQFSCPAALDFLAPALGLASGLSLYLSRSKYDNRSRRLFDVGEWILVTSPTPFNRFVLLRCPSISFEGSEFLEDVNEKLVEEERHFVRLNSGGIQVKSEESGNGGLAEKLKYQRVCVSTQDGGVISIDWPANLELKEERGLDTTLLLVPGTTRGSMDESVRSFVCEALKRGYFPVVMNPRGCAGSPLTNARLFTAADSDDVCTAIQFISETRPWTTLMGIGWGCGANMLTKYLAEVGDRTPLTAATCINNPFDLEEITRCSPYHSALDQMLTNGLTDILQSNKELFQGKAKGFDVEKAISAKSVRDFEKAISMVSYGFEEIEDFYSAFSTRGVIGNVKIPVLFIQNDDGTVPPFSIPRSQIAENPFTSLLLFSSTQSNVNASDKVAESWCQNFTIEWLTAVELGLLKGRHPLLNDVDVTINPSKGFALVEGRSSNQGGANKLLDLTPTDANANGYAMYPTKEMSSNSDTADRLHSRSKQDVQGNVEIRREMEEVDDDLTKDEGADPMDSERGEVLQTTRVVMNMLDISMPGCLTEEEKRKVLTAVGQGETLMKALQDAVPGDVREKLTTAVSGILQAQQRNLKLEELLGFGKILNASSGLKSKIQEEVGEVNVEGASKDPHSSDIAKRADELLNGSDDSQSGLEKSSDGLAPELHPSESKKKPLDSGPSYQSTGSQQVDASGSARKIANELGNISGTDDYSKEKTASCPDCADRGLDTSGKSSTGKANVTEEAIVDEKVDQDSGKPEIEIKKDFNIVKNEEKTLISSTDQNKIVAGNMTEDAPSPMKSSSESQSMEKEGIDNHQKESRTSQPVLDQNKNVSDSSTPTFNVAQALDALAGVDDSTQVAVNSVFGVIENMISQLEEEKDDETNNKDESKVEDKTVDLPLKKRDISVLPPATAKQDSKNDLQIKSNALQDPPVCEQNENNSNSSRAACTGWLEEEPAADSSLLSADGTDGSLGIAANNHNGGGKEHDQLLGNNFLADHNDRHVGKIPLCVNAFPYGDYIHNGYLGRYLLSKVTKTKPLDLDTTTALFLDYFPEEGQWKLLEQPGSFEGSKGDATNHNRVGEKVYGHSSAKLNDSDNIIEPPFVILDTEKHGTVGEYDTEETFDQALQYDDRLEELMQTVKSVILDALKVEAGRKLSTATMKEMKPNLDKDLEEVANAVSLAIIHDKDHTWHLDGKNFSSNCTSEKIGTLNGEHILRAISSAVLGTSYLRRFLPVGVIIGTSLAALRKFFIVATGHDNSIKSVGCENSGDETDKKYSARDIDQKLTKRTDPVIRLNATRIRDRKESELRTKNSDSVMVGAVTAALGASALLMQQQGQYNEKEIVDISPRPFKQNANTQKVADKVDEPISEKNQNNNLVTSLAEKAMSVAGPVVPTKEDGELDQERLVAILTDLGQRGGILRLVGKVALLWGGMRGAMSLADRLILFLRIAERPLYQRILGFVGMMLVLWSPVIVPLLPTLVQSWTTGSPSRFAELVSIFGLYTAVLILVVLWGKRIRGYEDPLAQYGLDLISPPKIHNFFKGFIGGTILVLSIQSVNAVVGCVSFSWPSILLSPSLGAMTSLKVFGRLTLLASRGIITASGVALVEELLFRSWLPEEIATNLGYHQGIIISGLVFSLLQGSLRAVPGLWLLSLALAGLRQRSKGNLAIPIGLRTGIMASSFVLQTGGFLSYNLNSPLWFTGTRPFQPFSGVVGLAFALFLAIILYPRKSFRKRKRLKRIIRE